MSRYIAQLSETTDPDLITERNKSFNHLVLNEHEFGNYKVKFSAANNPQITAGTCVFTHKNGFIANGHFEVYISDDGIHATLYSGHNVKMLDKPFDEYLNIIKLMLLSR
ncbi:hypothetical protein SAMN05216464_103144 [Mucilaginibacter pineti]|uniref:Uncharacterized protein n=1 Tax=Mucilaginibacter pineti TaxID=1391627 RepID=A0A1G6YYD8_9SPHI|nr:hypothetical protein [Mucilaginibacter pineti]SDD95368.1 hypothetical protein SAMN05216464_103144 [Mucilaginibacter pineti]